MYNPTYRDVEDINNGNTEIVTVTTICKSQSILVQQPEMRCMPEQMNAEPLQLYELKGWVFDERKH